MNARQRIMRLSIGCALACLATSGQPAHAAAGSVFRYHLVQGVTISYRLQQTSTLTAMQSGRSLPDEQLTSTALMQYRFLSVNPAGTQATVQIRTANAVQTARQANRTSTEQIAATDQRVTQFRDGRQTATDVIYGGYALYDFGILADRAVKVGDHWSSTIENTAGVKGAALACTNTLTAVIQAATGPRATVKTACQTRIGPTAVHIPAGAFTGTASEALGGTWQFDSTAGVFVSEQVTRTVVLTGTLGSGAAAPSYRLHEVDLATFARTLAPGDKSP